MRRVGRRSSSSPVAGCHAATLSCQAQALAQHADPHVVVHKAAACAQEHAGPRGPDGRPRQRHDSARSGTPQHAARPIGEFPAAYSLNCATHGRVCPCATRIRRPGIDGGLPCQRRAPGARAAHAPKHANTRAPLAAPARSEARASSPKGACGAGGGGGPRTRCHSVRRGEDGPVWDDFPPPTIGPASATGDAPVGCAGARGAGPSCMVANHPTAPASRDALSVRSVPSAVQGGNMCWRRERCARALSPILPAANRE